MIRARPVILPAIMLLLLLSGCVRDSALKTGIASANDALRSYSFTMTMSGTATGKTQDASQVVASNTSIAGSVDRISKSVHSIIQQERAVATREQGTANPSGPLSVTGYADFYYLDNTTYIKSERGWERKQGAGWTQLDQLRQLTKLVKDSTLQGISETTENGKDYQVLTILPDKKELIAALSQDSPFAGDARMTVTVWIDKESRLIERARADSEIAVSGYTVRTRSDVIITGQNEDMAIALPEDARAAAEQDAPDMIGVS